MKKYIFVKDIFNNVVIREMNCIIELSWGYIKLVDRPLEGKQIKLKLFN